MLIVYDWGKIVDEEIKILINQKMLLFDYIYSFYWYSYLYYRYSYTNKDTFCSSREE